MKNAKFSTQITESEESKSERIKDIFSGSSLKSLEFPVIEDGGFVTGVFTGFEPIQPTGEVKTNRKGNVWTDKSAQLKFSFTVPTESGGELVLNFWTGTCIDGVKDEQGRFSKLVTWLVAIGAIESNSLHPKFKAEESSIMTVIREAFEGTFKFKTEMKGRIHVPVIDSFQLIRTKTEES